MNEYLNLKRIMVVESLYPQGQTVYPSWWPNMTKISNRTILYWESYDRLKG